ncbi:hypothetical protein [Frigidibacter sp. ROC022]|uniref:hypothetical protein n=1 Tax=Frigidibacter sp. ROC022 TaxID=2971796 RepID=UPI00215B12CF|nr:hypothetical protein [Frigidibacter sp. ROC022]
MSSNPDSFIDEVTEEVRRDRLFALFRRYGWIGVLAIVLIVGWSAWLEWDASRQRARAQAFGDAVIAALEKADPADRAAALEGITAKDKNQATLLTLLGAATKADAPKLAELAADPEIPAVYRDLAAFRRLLLLNDLDEAERIAGFEALATPGAPYRVLAEEQIALIDITAGRTDKALERLEALSEDSEASGALQRRAKQLMVAIGGTPGN